MPNSSPSKLTLWMEYSLADLDNAFSPCLLVAPSPRLFLALWQIRLAAGHTNALIVSFCSSATQVQASTGREPPRSKTSYQSFFTGEPTDERHASELLEELRTLPSVR